MKINLSKTKAVFNSDLVKKAEPKIDPSDKSKYKDSLNDHVKKAYTVSISQYGKKKSDLFNQQQEANSGFVMKPGEVNLAPMDGIEKQDTAAVQKQDDKDIDKTKQTVVTAPEKEEEKGAFAEYTERLNEILEKIQDKKAVSAKDKEWLEGELKSIISGHYNALKEMKFSREDILDTLVDNMKQRLRILNDMLEKTEGSENPLTQDFSMLQQEFEIKDQEELIERLTEALEEEEEDLAEEKAETTEEAEGTEDELVAEEQLSLEHDSLEDEKRADKRISQTREAIDGVARQGAVEEENAISLGNLVEEARKRIEKMVDSNDFSIEEKVMATKDYMSRAQEMTVEKEKQRIQAEYDRETVRLTSLMFGQHDDINEVLKRNRYRIQAMTSKVAADLLAMKGR